MKQTGHLIILFLTFSFSILSCNINKSPKEGRDNTIAIENQDVDLANQFDKYFKDPNQIIPFALYFKMTNEKLDTTFFSSILSNDRIKNGDCIFYIVQINCIAGGDCAEYKLLSLCNFKFNSIKTIGKDRADAEYSLQFSYKIIDSTKIDLINEEERYNDDFETVFDTIIRTPLELK